MRHPTATLTLALCLALTWACGGEVDEGQGDAGIALPGPDGGDSGEDGGGGDAGGGDADAGADGGDDAGADAGDDAGSDDAGADADDASADAAADAVADAVADADAGADADAADADAGAAMGWSGAPIALADYVATKLSESCKTILACQGKPDVPAFATLEGCVAMLGAEGFGVLDADLAVAAGKGVVSYSPTAGGVCVQSLSYDCGAFAAGGAAACGLAFSGTVDDGGACTLAAACKTGYCDLPETGCPGVCKPKVGADGACVLDEACQVGLACVDGVCVDASPAAVTKPCNYNLPCAAGLWCAYNGPKGNCLPVGDVGAPCQSQKSCKDGLTCAFDSKKCETPGKLGGPCALTPILGNPTACEAGAICVPDSGSKDNKGVCAAKAQIGGACVSPPHCGALDVLCNGADAGSGTCAPVGKAGGPCGAPNYALGTLFVCLPPLLCVDKVCTAPPTKGEACLVGVEAPPCAEGLACAASGLCGDPPGAGQPCTSSCAEGLLCTQKEGAWICAAPNCGT